MKTLVVVMLVVVAGSLWVLAAMLKMMVPLKRDVMRLLVLSDVHDDIAALGLLASDVADEHFDAILCPGDFTTMPNPVAVGDTGWEDPSPAERRDYGGRAALVVQAMRQIRPTARLLFAPGNHDPPPMFDGAAASTPQGDGNLHGRFVTLAPDLVVAGWGGSVEATQNGREVWSAYPWRDGDLGSSGLRQLAEDLGKLPPTTRVLLLTHSGPASASTSWVTGVDPNSLREPGVQKHPIMSGSEALQSALVTPDAMQRRVALQLHGHTHQGAGLARLGAVPVSNPGSLRYTRTYGVATLARTPGRLDQPWSLVSADTRTLGAGGVGSAQRYVDPGDFVPFL